MEEYKHQNILNNGAQVRALNAKGKPYKRDRLANVVEVLQRAPGRVAYYRIKPDYGITWYFREDLQEIKSRE